MSKFSNQMKNQSKYLSPEQPATDAIKNVLKPPISQLSAKRSKFQRLSDAQLSRPLPNVLYNFMTLPHISVIVECCFFFLRLSVPIQFTLHTPYNHSIKTFVIRRKFCAAISDSPNRRGDWTS